MRDKVKNWKKFTTNINENKTSYKESEFYTDIEHLANRLNLIVSLMENGYIIDNELKDGVTVEDIYKEYKEKFETEEDLQKFIKSTLEYMIDKGGKYIHKY